jgi:maltose alpha-D-glucosyltransferase / alpha-amylase
MVFVHNLADTPGVVDLGSLSAEAEMPIDVLADQEYPDLGKLDAVTIEGYGYRWIRLRRYP